MDHSTSVQDVFALIPADEIRQARDNNSVNVATLCYKATEKLVKAVDNSCRTESEQQAGKLQESDIFVTKNFMH